jgi:trigger factor
MSTLIEKKDNQIVILTIDVPAEDFSEALKRSFVKNANRFNVPGFRRGKAPMGIVTKYYGEGVLYDDAIDFIATPAYAKAVKEHNLEPVSRPEMDIISISREEGLRFSVTITVKPDVTLGDYRGVEAVRPEYPVSEADVDRDLQRVIERNARMIPVEDRPLQEGDTANIDYEGCLDGIPFEGGKGAGYDLKIGSKTFIPGFEDQLIGKSTGEEFAIDVTFPEDYENTELQNKAVVFSGKINSIKVRELPAADDDFARDVSEFNSLAEYHESLRSKLVESAQHRADASFEDNVVRAAVEKTSIVIPQVMIDQEVDHMVEEQQNQMRYQGIELEQYLQYVGQDMAAFREQLRDSAESRVKTTLVLDAIAKAEAIDATEAEIDAEIERMAGLYNMKPEELRSRLASSESDFVRGTVVNQKTVALLKESAIAIAAPPHDTEDDHDPELCDNPDHHHNSDESNNV